MSNLLKDRLSRIYSFFPKTYPAPANNMSATSPPDDVSLSPIYPQASLL